MDNDTKGIKQRCKYCKHEWEYSGDMDKSTCSNCNNKNWVVQAHERYIENNVE